MRILIVTEIPAPFRIPLFNALAAEPDVELTVAFLAEHDPRRSYRVYRDEFRFRELGAGRPPGQVEAGHQLVQCRTPLGHGNLPSSEV